MAAATGVEVRLVPPKNRQTSQIYLNIKIIYDARDAYSESRSAW